MHIDTGYTFLEMYEFRDRQSPNTIPQSIVSRQTGESRNGHRLPFSG